MRDISKDQEHLIEVYSQITSALLPDRPDFISEEMVVESTLRIPELVDYWNEFADNHSYDRLEEDDANLLAFLEYQLLRLMWRLETAFADDVHSKEWVPGTIDFTISDLVDKWRSAKRGSEHTTEYIKK